ncbi:restriction endonuclease subunit S [Halobaculum sp. WSA2]|uniref:Restriction endonuclease subunit S n=1 Tax=Halobaculum saliterrae TaxID=2073113 RepID=A0A6B0SRS4_9EURY|nr:restriction endonuclease subunit S [Halobaculum saliterrae]MXR41237.1 restriction endonuclease subunit S [Halobaculum saliterrae]
MSESSKLSKHSEEGKRVKMGPRTLIIPEDWEDVAFEDAIELNPSYDKPDRESFAFLPMDAVDEDKQTIEYWMERERDDCTSTWFTNGDTVYPKITPCTENGKIALIEGVETEFGSGSTEFLVFHPREGITDDRFVYYLSNLPDFRAVTISLMEGSTGRQRVPSDVFEGGIHIPLPSLAEQRHLADILSTVDEQIQQTAEIIEKRDELLTGLKQDLLLGRSGTDQQEIQMGPKSVWIDSSWDVSKLGDVGHDGEKSFVDGDWVESDDMVADGPYQLIQLGNIGIGEFKGECDKFVSEGFFQENNCTLVEKGDLLISRLADPVLRTIEVPEFEKKSITAVDIVVAKVDESAWDKRYLRFLLNSKVMSDVGGALATGSTRQRISRKNMETITIPKPPRETQTQIADVLETAHTEVKAEKRYKENLQDLKRGLMQDLLTGKTRVNIN